MSVALDRTSRLRVALIEDQRPVREGLAELIGESQEFELTGAWESMEQAIPVLQRGQPDVLLTDLGLPGIDGVEGIRRIRQFAAELPIIVLTVHQDDDRIFDALCAGACGYLLKKAATTRLLDAVREAVSGGAPMSPEIARRVVALFASLKAKPAEDFGLTPHEVRVLRLLVEGHSYKTAASELGVAPATIAFHVRKIYEKLQVTSRSEAVAKALRSGLLE